MEVQTEAETETQTAQVISGVVKNGVVVPDNGFSLPEGTRVQIQQMTMEFTPAEQAEFELWDKASDEAWAMIDKWEREEQQKPGEQL